MRWEPGSLTTAHAMAATLASAQGRPGMVFARLTVAVSEASIATGVHPLDVAAHLWLFSRLNGTLDRQARHSVSGGFH